MISYDAIQTEQAVEFVKNNLNFLGKIHSIEHNRLKFETEYQTVITGSEETMIITGGLTSGYAGEGSKGLVRVLEALGIKRDDAIHYTKDRETYKKGFKHTFIVGLD